MKFARVLLIATVIGFFSAGAGTAANPEPVHGTQSVSTKIAYDEYVEKLRASVKANGLAVVAEACAHCGAKKIGVTIPGNRVIMVFHPRFAVRMLEASVPAGIEAPLRLYVTEQPDGTAKLTYPKPSTVFKPYQDDALHKMAIELDDIFAKIVKGSMS